MRVHGRRTVTRKVLVCRDDAAVFHRSRECARHRRHELRVGTEGSIADDLVLALEGEIEHRREIEIAAGTPEIVPADVGSTDANIAVSMGIPGGAIGATDERLPHRLEENVDASSIVPGIKAFIVLAVALTTH